MNIAPLEPGHWTTLPFPFSELGQGKLSITIAETGVDYDDCWLWVDRNEGDDTLFSVVIVIDGLKGEDQYSFLQLHVRLSPEYVARLAPHPPISDEAFRYHLEIPEAFLVAPSLDQ